MNNNNPIKVTNNNDGGIGSLRYAIDYANSNPGIDTIDLTGISGTINLNSTLNIGAGVKMHGRSLVLMRRMSPYQDSPWLMGTLKEAMAPMVVVVD
ncbi:MAG: hypothetical protein GPJ15_14080 [Microcystis aeruginosa G11-06]|nr:hypothetical protein [Microcystis aeruginosa G11-06]